MKRYIVFLSFLSLCYGMWAQTYPKDNNVIRILTYNAHYCKGGTDPGSINDGNTRYYASVIKALDADIVSLQELDSGMNSRGRRFLLEEIAKMTELNYTPVYGNATKLDGGSVGCGSLIKKDFAISRIKKIALPGDEPRVAVRTDLDDFVFISTHGDLNDTKRMQGANLISNEVDFIRKPVFLAGDLNDCHRWGNGGIAFPIFMEKFTIASDTKGNTVWHGSHGNEGADQGLIDYVLFRDHKNSGIEIVGTNIVRTIEIAGSKVDLKTVSDHYPVYVDIKLPRTADVENVTDRAFKINVSKDNILHIIASDNIEKVEIYSLTGKKCLEQVGQNIDNIDVSPFSKGIYLVKASSEKQSWVEKIVKN